jgi:hypothetical protein
MILRISIVNQDFNSELVPRLASTLKKASTLIYSSFKSFRRLNKEIEELKE